jgi:DNA polymerase I-like protein with 3'-5' exonuclease and polymerase domains
VHDELIYEIKENKLTEAQEIIENAMKHAIPKEFLKGLQPVPLEVSVHSGKTWGDLK